MLNRKQIKKIEDIVITKEELEKANDYLKIHNKDWMDASEYTHYLKRETNIQGLCCCCLNIPTKLVSFRSGIVERYCNEHLHRIKDDLDTDNILDKVTVKAR